MMSIRGKHTPIYVTFRLSREKKRIYVLIRDITGKDKEIALSYKEEELAVFKTNVPMYIVVWLQRKIKPTNWCYIKFGFDRLFADEIGYYEQGIYTDKESIYLDGIIEAARVKGKNLNKNKSKENHRRRESEKPKLKISNSNLLLDNKGRIV